MSYATREPESREDTQEKYYLTRVRRCRKHLGSVAPWMAWQPTSTSIGRVRRSDTVLFFVYFAVRFINSGILKTRKEEQHCRQNSTALLLLYYSFLESVFLSSVLVSFGLVVAFSGCLVAAFFLSSSCFLSAAALSSGWAGVLAS